MPLVGHFVEKAGAANSRKILRISSPAEMLRAYAWPGNIRQLENVIERAVILSGADGVIDTQHLPAWMREQDHERMEADPEGKLEDAVNTLEKRLIIDALETCGGNMSRAAARLGLTERMMGLRMKKYALAYSAFRKFAKENKE